MECEVQDTKTRQLLLLKKLEQPKLYAIEAELVAMQQNVCETKQGNTNAKVTKTYANESSTDAPKTLEGFMTYPCIL